MAQKGQQEIRAQGACRKNTQKRRSIRHLAARGELFSLEIALGANKTHGSTKV